MSSVLEVGDCPWGGRHGRGSGVRTGEADRPARKTLKMKRLFLMMGKVIPSVFVNDPVRESKCDARIQGPR